jgi:3,4-dihydroxy-2-butanone 4-phosphate synthase
MTDEEIVMAFSDSQRNGRIVLTKDELRRYNNEADLLAFARAIKSRVLDGMSSPLLSK